MCSFESHRMYYGWIKDPVSGSTVDEVLAVFMQAPNSYTREDVVEIQCHGSYLVLQEILSLILAHGARLAQPGEFTKRAFLNGRLDLTQAEAVLEPFRGLDKYIGNLIFGEFLPVLLRELHRAASIEHMAVFPT